MEYVFLDTNIFIQDNFLEGKKINEFFKLSKEGAIGIVIPEIIYNEVKRRATTSIKDSISKFNTYRNNTRILRNVSLFGDVFKPVDEEEAIKEFLTKLDEVIRVSKCIIIAYPTIDVKSVFDKYFNSEFPFCEGKKHEFPDAFALLTIENWCKENKVKCHVFSHDKTILNYQSEQLVITEKYEEYLDDKIREVEKIKHEEKRINNAIELFERKRFELELEINDWVVSQLCDVYTYKRMFDYELIYDIDVSNCVTVISEPLIVSLNPSEIVLESYVEVNFTAIVVIDDDNSGYFDDELLETLYNESAYEEITTSLTIDVEFVIESPIAGEEFTDVRISQINHGQNIIL